jgi:hypothetical protein
VEGPLLAWWSLLCVAAAVNAAGWVVCLHFLRRRSFRHPEFGAVRRQLLWLAAIYVLGCGFRSVLPMVDVPRICLHDTWISRIFVGRSVATVAELAFAAQWVLLLREASAGRDLPGLAARLILPLIVAAEVASWSAILFSNDLLHAVENSLWTLAAALALAGFGALHGRLEVAGRRFLYAAALCGGAYVAFMVLIDVPMYLSRWSAGVASATSLAQGLESALARCVVAHDWLAWREDALWLSLYFTAAVWISLVLPHAPALRPGGVR